jgi:hypothetical protein
MNESFPRPPFLLLFPIILLIAITESRAVSSPLPFSLKLTQTINTDLASSTAASFDSELLDGKIRWTADDIAESIADGSARARLRPETWSLRVKPLPEISILTGSVSYKGLPARANNAVFSVVSPFHAPLEADDAPLLAMGTSQTTGTFAMEIRSGAWDIAGYTARPEDPDGTTWISCSATRESFSRQDTNFSVAAFSGNRTTPKRSDDSWTVDVPDITGMTLSVTGGEIAFRLGEIGGSATFLANAEAARSIRSMGRGEIFIDAGPAFFSSGYYRADRDFRELNGTSPSVLSRFYLSPQLRIRPGINDRFLVRTGAVLCHDILAGEKFWYENEKRLSGGTGIEVDSEPADFSSKFMATNETLSADASLRMRKLFMRALKPSLSATMSWGIENAFRPHPEKIEPRASLLWIPVERKRTTFRVTLGYREKIKLPDTVKASMFSLTLEQSFLGSRATAKISLGASYEVIESRPLVSLAAIIAIR